MLTEAQKNEIRHGVEEGAADIVKSGKINRLLEEFQRDNGDAEAWKIEAARHALPYLLSLFGLIRGVVMQGGDLARCRIEAITDAIDGAYLWGKLKPVTPEFRMIEDDGIGVIIIEGMLECIRGRAMAYWKERIHADDKTEGDDTPDIAEEETMRRAFLTLPSAPAVKSLFDLFGVGSDLWENPKQLMRRERALDTHRKFNIEKDVTRPEIIRVTIETRSASQAYEVDWKYLSGTNAGIKKVFSFISTKVSALFHDDILAKNAISFPLQELVDAGLYSSLDTARKGFEDAGEALIRIGVKGWLKLSNKKRYEQVDIGTFFILFRIKKNVCIVKINPDFAWGMFTAFYTPLPPYAYELKINAFTLISLIFTTARQRWENIGEKAVMEFPIKMRHIQTRLALPDESTTKNPRRDIRDVIECAIEEIEEKSNTNDFQIDTYQTNGQPMKDKTPISEFLEGYIVIKLKGDYVESFKAIAANAKKRIKAAHKRKAQTSTTKGNRGGDQTLHQ